MPSGLMRKLNAMKSGTSAPAKVNTRALVCRSYSCPADERLFNLSPTALRRLGYNGAHFDISRTLFLDTETTGLSGGAGTVAFLVGIGYVKDGLFTVEQYLMPDYSGEIELLKRVAEHFPNHDTVVHFNGRTFDMPLLHSRFVLMRMEDEWKELDQIDLLTSARRVWKLRLGGCRLGQLEEKILGMPRHGDIPGSEIPQRYFDAVKSGSISGLEDVIDHNRQDIVTLGTLLCVLAERFGEPEKTEEQLDIFSIGKALERQGEITQARRLYHIAAAPRTVTTLKDLIGEKYAGEANFRLYHIYRRNGEFEKAEQVLLNMIRRGQMGRTPKLELAKLYEHKLKRLPDALRLAQELRGRCLPDETEALDKRIDRLKQKIQKAGG